MSITYWRAQIDEIDRALIALISERARCARTIGRLKREQQLPIVDASREAEIQTNVEATNNGPLETEALQKIFERIVDEMRLLQENTPEENKESNEVRPT